MNYFYFIELTIFFILSIFVAYNTLFAVASIFRHHDVPPTEKNAKRIAILIPAYREDNVILETVKACAAQQYPRDRFEIIVLSDNMSDDTNQQIVKLSAKFIEIKLPQSSKIKSLQYAINQLSGFDITLILDADNLIEPLYLQKINSAFLSGMRAVQTHRKAKNLNTSIAVLDAISEEINNSIFRKGHSNLGLPPALIGSGMAFDFNDFKKKAFQIKTISGEDKELDLLYMKEGIRIGYLEHAIVLDEKIQKKKDFGKQRKRWIAAQREMLLRFCPYFLPALLKGNFIFCGKIFQNVLPPRLILLGQIIIITLITTDIDPSISIKWWILLGSLVASYLMCVPKHLFTLSSLRSIIHLPHVFLIMMKNHIWTNNASKHFIHTPHGINDKKRISSDETNN